MAWQVGLQQQQQQQQQQVPDTPLRSANPADQLQDTCQVLEWSPTANFLAAGSWDNTIKVWQVQNDRTRIEGKMSAQQKVDGPVLDVGWDNSGTKLFTASCDKTVRVWDLNTNQMQQIGQHDAPVKTCHFIPSMNLVMTGSWDKTLKFWDCRSPQPAVTKQLSERVVDVDFIDGQFCVVVTKDSTFSIYLLGAGGVQENRQGNPKMTKQLRCVTAFGPQRHPPPQKGSSADSYGFAIGSIEGRVGVHYVDPQQDADNRYNFAFKCHRSDQGIYAVNSIHFHPVHNTFATCGSDGKYVFWNKDDRNRVKSFDQIPAVAPITCGRFSGDGKLFAYAVGYDWSKGHQHYNKQGPNEIMMHYTYFNEGENDECMKKVDKKGGVRR